MKMAKAREKDIEAAGDLLNILNTIDGRFGGPWPTDGPESLEQAIGEDSFDADIAEHLQGLYNSLASLLRRVPNFHGRVIGGMCYVILYDKNQIVDPESDCLELHPRLTAAIRDADRYRLLRRGQKWSVIDGVGDTLHADELDAAIDAVMIADADASREQSEKEAERGTSDAD